MTKGWTVDVRLKQRGGSEKQLWPWEAAIAERDAAEQAVRERLTDAEDEGYIVTAVNEMDEHEVAGRGLTPGMVRQVLTP